MKMGRLFTNERCDMCGKLDCCYKKLQETISEGKIKLAEFSYAVSQLD
jgi:uncharacterized cysteine cluster protein YcgN (CxxCxxCC family)